MLHVIACTGEVDVEESGRREFHEEEEEEDAEDAVNRSTDGQHIYNDINCVTIAEHLNARQPIVRYSHDTFDDCDRVSVLYM